MYDVSPAPPRASACDPSRSASSPAAAPARVSGARPPRPARGTVAHAAHPHAHALRRSASRARAARLLLLLLLLLPLLLLPLPPLLLRGARERRLATLAGPVRMRRVRSPRRASARRRAGRSLASRARRQGQSSRGQAASVEQGAHLRGILLQLLQLLHRVCERLTAETKSGGERRAQHPWRALVMKRGRSRTC